MGMGCDGVTGGVSLRRTMDDGDWMSWMKHPTFFRLFVRSFVRSFVHSSICGVVSHAELSDRPHCYVQQLVGTLWLVGATTGDVVPSRVESCRAHAN